MKKGKCVKMQRFTKREREVLILLIQGYDNPEISRQLIISEHTTKAHISSIYAKIGYSNRVQATLACYFLCTSKPAENKDFIEVFTSMKKESLRSKLVKW